MDGRSWRAARCCCSGRWHWRRAGRGTRRSTSGWRRARFFCRQSWTWASIWSTGLPPRPFGLKKIRMAYASFTDFTTALDKAGELKRIGVPVATELEITEIADREMKSPGGGKALLFEMPTVNGVVSPFPVAINTLG